MKCESTGVRLQHGQDFQRDGGVAKMERKEASEVAEVAISEEGGGKRIEEGGAEDGRRGEGRL